MFVNLSAVMLRLCEPFLDPHLTKRDKIDPKYAFCGHRLKLRYGPQDDSTCISSLILIFS